MKGKIFQIFLWLLLFFFLFFIRPDRASAACPSGDLACGRTGGTWCSGPGWATNGGYADGDACHYSAISAGNLNDANHFQIDLGSSNQIGKVRLLSATSFAGVWSQLKICLSNDYRWWKNDTCQTINLKGTINEGSWYQFDFAAPFAQYVRLWSSYEAQKWWEVEVYPPQPTCLLSVKTYASAGGINGNDTPVVGVRSDFTAWSYNGATRTEIWYRPQGGNWAQIGYGCDSTTCYGSMTTSTTTPITYVCNAYNKNYSNSNWSPANYGAWCSGNPDCVNNSCMPGLGAADCGGGSRVVNLSAYSCSAWSGCSNICGGSGTKTRSCSNAYGSLTDSTSCSGDYSGYDNITSCTGWSECSTAACGGSGWTGQTCTHSCGTTSSLFMCYVSQGYNIGVVDPSRYGSWSSCSAACGGGTQTRAVYDLCGNAMTPTSENGGVQSCNTATTASCTTSVGTCSVDGTRYCSNGSWGSCQPNSDPRQTCASTNNCGVACGTGSCSDGCGGTLSCYVSPTSRSCNTTFGSCTVSGSQACVNGQWSSTCSATDPRIAACQGKICGQSDGCGGSCSTSGLTTCSDGCNLLTNTTCGQKYCTNQCGSKIVDSCGSTPSSASCSATFGTCTVNGTQTCTASNWSACSATDPRVANCNNKHCGETDGCGGSCSADWVGIPYNYGNDWGACSSVCGAGTQSQSVYDQCGNLLTPTIANGGTRNCTDTSGETTCATACEYPAGHTCGQKYCTSLCGAQITGSCSFTNTQTCQTTFGTCNVTGSQGCNPTTNTWDSCAATDPRIAACAGNVCEEPDGCGSSCSGSGHNIITSCTPWSKCTPSANTCGIVGTKTHTCTDYCGTKTNIEESCYTTSDAGVIQSAGSINSGSGRVSQNGITETDPLGYRQTGYASNLNFSAAGYPVLLDTVLRNTGLTMETLQAYFSASPDKSYTTSAGGNSYHFWQLATADSLATVLSNVTASGDTGSVHIVVSSASQPPAAQTITGLQVPNTKKIVVFLNNNLTVSGNITTNTSQNTDSSVVFVLGEPDGVPATLTVAPAVTRLDGVYIFKGEFNDGGGTVQLTGYGSLLNIGSEATPVGFNRMVATGPSEQWFYQPKYLTIYRTILSRPNYIFTELLPQ